MLDRSELLGVQNFRVFLGKQEIGFCTVEGLVSELGEHDGELADRVRPVVLRRALGQDKTLFRWRERAAAGNRLPRDVSIDLLRPGGDECVNTWVLQGAWPTRWSGPVLDASSDAVALEELELAYEALLWQDQAGDRSRSGRPARRKTKHQ
jgi:T4-like virus tail tube protein gp19